MTQQIHIKGVFLVVKDAESAWWALQAVISSGGRLGTGQFADCQQLRATLQYLADLPQKSRLWPEVLGNKMAVLGSCGTSSTVGHRLPSLNSMYDCTLAVAAPPRSIL